MKEMLNTLARRSFAANRVRNLIAVLAIALTAVLFTSVTTISFGTLQSVTLTGQLTKMSRSDAEIHNLTPEQFEALKKADFVKEAGLRMPVNFLTNSNLHNIEFDIMDETEARLTFAAPTHGSFPQAANEIVTSDRALSDLGAEVKIGAEVTIEFTVHDKAYRMPMVVSGWYEAVNDQVSYLIAGTAFRDAYPEIFQNPQPQNGVLAGTCYSDIIAASPLSLQEKLDDFSRSQGGNPDDMTAENYMPGIVNQMTNPTPDTGTLAAAAAAILLFVFCGYLLIYNVFDIAVMQDIRRFGLYRTIGMSKKQVRKLINRQAVWLSLAGIPLGLAAGYFIGKQTMPFIMATLDTQYANISSDVSPSLPLFAIAALFSAFTVFLSTRKPVRTASSIPPIEAFRYVETAAGRGSKKHSADSAGPARMAFSNIGRNKRRTAFIITSLMLCIVLLNCAGTAAHSMDIEKQVGQMIRTDFAVLNANSMNLMKGFTTRDMGLSAQTIADLSALPYTLDGAPVYKNTLEDTNVTYDFGLEWASVSDSAKSDLKTGTPDHYYYFTLGTDNRALCNVYGMEEASVSRMRLKEGITDAETLYRKMEAGEGILLGVPGKMGSDEMKETGNFLDVGDVITVYKDGIAIKELPVLAKAVLNGDDEEIGYTVNGAQTVGGDGLYLYLPFAVYQEIYDEPVIYKYSFNVEEGHWEEITSWLDNYRTATDPSINYLSAANAYAAAEGNRSMINFVGSMLGLIFGLAGILNLINMMITSILTRRHEFATMRSIGMTDRQLTAMLTFEGICYALGAAVSGLILACVFSLTLVRSICRSIWFFTFRLTLAPALAASALLLLIAAAVPGIFLRLFNRGSIVEQLRIAE